LADGAAVTKYQKRIQVYVSHYLEVVAMAIRIPIYRRQKCSNGDIAFVELLARFLSHAKKHYRHPNESSTSEIKNFKLALKPLKELYGFLSVRDFSPLKLKGVRQQFIAKGLTRKSINKMVGRIHTVFRWGTENELVPPDIIHGLQAVSGLQQGTYRG